MTVICPRCNGRGIHMREGRLRHCIKCHGIGRVRKIFWFKRNKYKNVLRPDFKSFFEYRRKTPQKYNKEVRARSYQKNKEKIRVYDREYKKKWRRTEEWRKKNREYQRLYRARKKNTVDKDEKVL